MKMFKYALIAGLAFILMGIIGAIGVLVKYSRDLPSLDAVRNYTPRVVTTLFSDDDKVIKEYSEERRKILPLEDMPKNGINAFIAAEDNDFFTHRGINPITILRATFKNIQAGEKVQGGSTITQQVAKSILLTPEKTFSRKIREILLAFKIEKEFTKQEILHLYLNHIFLGNGAYGIEEASQTYFGKSAKDLSIPEAAILAGLPKAPSRDNPIRDPKAARHRQVYVLERMAANGMISKNELKEFLATPVKIKNRQNSSDTVGAYFVEHVRRYLEKKYGSEALKEEGLKVYTTMNLTNQRAAEDAIKVGLIALDKRAGMRQPSKNYPSENARQEYFEKQHLELVEKFYDYKWLNSKGELESPIDMKQPTPIEVGKNYSGILIEKDFKARLLKVRVGNRNGLIRPEDYKWTSEANPEEIYKERAIRNPIVQLKIGDVITVQPKLLKPSGVDEFFLEQEPLVQGSLLSYRIPDGALLAMVGGYDFNVTKSEFNRATQAVRQPGSTFKPFVYATALDNGLTPSTIIVDSPIVYKNNDEQTQMERVWRPDNFGERFYGDTSLRNALTFSRNIPTIKLLQYLKVGTVIDYAKKLGITSKLNADLSLALGSSGLTLEELLRGWSVFANHGNRLPTYFIRKVVDRDGKILEEHQTPPVEPVIPESTSFLMTSLLKSVVEIGTGVAAKALGRPVAGKTGTTNDFKDALFLGYVPQMITGVWVGFDEDRPIGRNETGGRSAAPIWLQYMQVATANVESKDFEVPPSVVQMQIDAETGDVPSPSTKKRLWEYFADGTAPGQVQMTPGPDGKPVAAAGNPINKTRIVTGNPDVVPSSSGGAQSSPDSDVNADSLMRDDL